MNRLVKILTDYLGRPVEPKDQVWHYVVDKGGTQTLCQGEYFGPGESGCEFEEKVTKHGGITCPRCIEEIKSYKAIKL